ncbi:hypothetical protein [Thiocapsa sp.]|nr:hypothetical protein [Thiocapsa sp.]
MTRETKLQLHESRRLVKQSFFARVTQLELRHQMRGWRHRGLG